MKILKVALTSAVLASVALCANVKEPSVQAKEVADKHFKLNKEATALQLKINEICKQKRQIMFDATSKLSREDTKAFYEELKYQKRQNLAKLKRGEDYIEDICKMPTKNMLEASKFGKISPKNIKTSPSPMNCPLAKHNSTR